MVVLVELGEAIGFGWGRSAGAHLCCLCEDLDMERVAEVVKEGTRNKVEAPVSLLLDALDMSCS